MRSFRRNNRDSCTRACPAAADRTAQSGWPARNAAGARPRHTAAHRRRKDRTGSDEDALRYPRTLCALYPVPGLNADSSTVRVVQQDCRVATIRPPFEERANAVTARSIFYWRWRSRLDRGAPGDCSLNLPSGGLRRAIVLEVENIGVGP